MDKLQEAIELASQGNLERAKVVFERILLKNPKDADSLYNLGMCFTELGQPAKEQNGKIAIILISIAGGIDLPSFTDEPVRPTGEYK